MKAVLRFAVIGTVLLATTGWAQSLGQTQAIGTLQVKEINVVEIDTSHVKVAVDLAMTPAESVTLNNMRLCPLSLNRMPVFAEPLNQEIVLRKGVVTALPPVYVTVLFRDLYTVKPLSDMIEEQKVHVDGELVAEIRLNVIDKLTLNTLHPKVAIAIDQDVPAEIGSNGLERTAALGILSAIETGLEAKAVAGNYIPTGGRLAWIRVLEGQAKPNLFTVVSSYSVMHGEQKTAVYLLEFGFRIGPDSVVTPAEAQAPWKYDAEYLGAARAGAVSMVKNSYDVELYPAGTGDRIGELSHKDFAVETFGTPIADHVAETGSGPGPVTVSRRASPSSLAVLKLRAPASTPGLTVAPAAVAAQDHWDQVAVFRRRNDAAGRPFVEAFGLSARRDGQTIRLSEPIDSAVFGSPIVTPDGVIGIVQDERVGAFLPAEMYPPGALVAK